MADVESNATSSKPEVAELTLDDLDFLVSENRYEAKHIAGVAKCLFKRHDLNFEKQFAVATSLTELEMCLQMLDSPREGLFIVYNMEDERWVTFHITDFDGYTTVLYKDSLGGGIGREERNVLEDHFERVIVKINFTREQGKDNNDGPMAIRNLEIIMEKCTINRVELVYNFASAMFCSSGEVQMLKCNFQDVVKKAVDDTCIEYAEDISEDSNFMKDVRELVDSCVKCIDLMKDIDSYCLARRAHAEEKQKNAKQENGESMLEELRETIKSHFQIKLWYQKSDKVVTQEIELKNSDSITDNTLQLELEKKYPCLMMKFTKIFQLLGVSNCTSYNGRTEELRVVVCAKLGIEKNTLDRLYQRFVIKLDVEHIPTPLGDVVQPLKENEIIGKTSGHATEQTSVQKGNTNSAPVREQAQPELTPSEKHLIFIDKYKNNPEILKLEVGFREVEKHYNEWKREEIKAWATKKRGRLEKQDLYETVAIMDRANALVTGHFLRDTQILAVLSYLQCNESEGKLCQISTGEGKTVIASLVATVKVLQGKQVDVITSNGVLAEEGINSRGNFFGVFGISVAHNNPDESYRRGPRKCYTADVVYGSMGSFQFDYLKDSFEGLETRGRRKFDFVILDEVDSLLLDNGGHIAKLAEPFPGFDSLKYVYIKIWQELAKAEQEQGRECKEGLERKVKELAKKSGTAKEKEEEFLLFSSEQYQRRDDTIIARIKNSDPANIDLIPIHLRQFAKDMVDVWIKNAIYAKYSCHENEQYVIRTLENAKEPKIVPVDNQGTGVTLKNTMWSNGLHQFVQLKHNLHLTSETLTSSLISNIGYVKLYNNNLFGLTGTLGSTAEQKLLSETYNVGYAKIPTFKPKVFQEISGKVVADNQFKKTIVEDVLKLTSKKRSVLIICSTIRKVLSLEKNFKKLQHDGLPEISTYFDEDSCEIVQKEIGVGEIIISTNIAGRGSDFKTSSDLESNGGLHVLVCFLPVNQRVEDQAFGRTSRQGNKGTAQIVVRESELLALGFETGDNLPFTVIKEIRDLREAERLDYIREVELAEIKFQDSIFGLFANLYRKLAGLVKKDPSKLYLLKDLKEFWSFWLHRKQNGEDLGSSVNTELEEFKKSAGSILGEEKNGMFVGGEITQNPYYSIQQAEHFILNNRLTSAEVSLNHAIQLCRPANSTGADESVVLLYPAYIKLFEVHIEQGREIMRKVFDLLKQSLKIKMKNTIEARENYKTKAIKALEKALRGLRTEIRYVEENFTDCSENNDISIVSNNNDFLNMLANNDEQTLFKHIQSKLTVLQTYLEQVQSLKTEIELCPAKSTIALSSKIRNYWHSDNLSEAHKDLRTLMCDDELEDLSLKGLGHMYALKVLPSIFDVGLIKPGLVQIGVGACALTTGLAFPPSLPIMAKLAEVFIVEGLSDLVFAIVTLNKATLEIGSKLFSYSIQLISIGVFAVFRYTQIAQRAIEGLQRLISVLENSTELSRLSQYVVPLINKVITLLEKGIALHRKTLAMQMTLKVMGHGVVSGGSMKITEFLLSGTVVEEILSLLRPKIVEYVNETVDRAIMRKVLVNVNKDIVLQQVSVVLNNTTSDIIKDIAKIFMEFVETMVKSSAMPESVKVKSATYTEDICMNLYERLKVLEMDRLRCRNSEEEVEELVKAISKKISAHVCDDLEKKIKKTVSLLTSISKLFFKMSHTPKAEEANSAQS